MRVRSRVRIIMCVHGRKPTIVVARMHNHARANTRTRMCRVARITCNII